MPRLQALEDLGSLAGVPVFVRVDLNVPMDGNVIRDDTRLRAVLPTIADLRERGARVLLFSHLGRPQGERRPELSLRPLAHALSDRLGGQVAFADDCIGPQAEQVVAGTANSGVALFENLRFHAAEEANDPAFAAALAGLAQAYVDDAFGCSHRAHASIVGVPERLERRAAGRLMEREIEALGSLLESPAKPFVAVLGGAKIASKIATLENLLPRIDVLLVGGAMANTFLKAQGGELGASLVADDELDLARQLLADAGDRGVEVVLPTDLTVTDTPPDRDAAGRSVETVAAGAVPAGWLALDVGPDTSAAFAGHLRKARTVFWNGPPGLFEHEPFDRGSRALAAAVAASPGYTVVGGGETVAVVNLAGVARRIDHVSTGGGASLELLAGLTLPGVAALAGRED